MEQPQHIAQHCLRLRARRENTAAFPTGCRTGIGEAAHKNLDNVTHANALKVASALSASRGQTSQVECGEINGLIDYAMRLWLEQAAQRTLVKTNALHDKFAGL